MKLYGVIILLFMVLYTTNIRTDEQDPEVDDRVSDTHKIDKSSETTGYYGEKIKPSTASQPAQENSYSFLLRYFCCCSSSCKKQNSYI